MTVMMPGATPILAFSQLGNDLINATSSGVRRQTLKRTKL